MDQRRNRTPYGSIAGHRQKPPIRSVCQAWYRNSRRAGCPHVALVARLPGVSKALRGSNAFAHSNWTFWPSNGTTATGHLLAKLDYFLRYLRDGSPKCLIAVHYLSPEYPRWQASCCLACRAAQTPSYCHSPPPRHTPTKMIPSRSWCSRAPCLVWSWSTSPTRIRPSRVPRSRSHRAMPQASSSPPRPMTKARPSLRSHRFRKAT